MFAKLIKRTFNKLQRKREGVTMKTKIGHLIFGMLFAGIAFSLFCITGTLRAEGTDITFATWSTPKHYSTFTVNKWLEMVKAEGKDKINIKYFPLCTVPDLITVIGAFFSIPSLANIPVAMLEYSIIAIAG